MCKIISIVSIRNQEGMAGMLISFNRTSAMPSYTSIIIMVTLETNALQTTPRMPLDGRFWDLQTEAAITPSTQHLDPWQLIAKYS